MKILTDSVSCSLAKGFYHSLPSQTSTKVLRGLRQLLVKSQRRRQLIQSAKQLQDLLAVAGIAPGIINFYCSDFGFYRRANSLNKQAVKLCCLSGQKTIIYHANFSDRNAFAFSTLQQLAHNNGWQLLEDRRKVINEVKYERRQRAAIMSFKVALSSFMLDSTSAFAADFAAFNSVDRITINQLSFASSDTQAATVVRPLGLFSPSSDYFSTPGFNRVVKSAVDNHIAHDLEANLLDELAAPESYSLEKYNQVLTILEKKWSKRKNDPGYLAEDFKQMARYIAARPHAYELLQSVSRQPWTLHYQAGEFRSDVRGSAFSVSSVKIYFDSRSAAILKAHQLCVSDAGHCMASPVDALLHELLHAKLALTETAEFIRSGGMNSVIYPYQHERKVIALENKMYSAMSNDDQKSRPRRRSHTGTLVTASCSTCIDS